MTHFIITYFGGDQPASPDEGRLHFAKYQKWLTSLGDSVIDPMVPFKNNHTIKPDGSSSEGSLVAMSGHTLIQAESIEEAISIAKACPFLDINGTIEVAERVQMS